MDVFVGTGRSKEEALDALKDKLWHEVWKECVELEGVVFVQWRGGLWVAKLEGLPGVDISERGAGGYGSTGN